MIQNYNTFRTFSIFFLCSSNTHMYDFDPWVIGANATQQCVNVIYVSTTRHSSTSFTNNSSPSPPPVYLWKSSLSNITSPTDSLLACRNLSIQCFRRGSDGWRPVFFRTLRTSGTDWVSKQWEVGGWENYLGGTLTDIKYENGTCSFPSVMA